MIKKILLLTLLISVATRSSFAQERGSFDFNKMFAGGTLVVGLGFGNNSQFTIGGNPELGYSIFKNIDLGLCGNYIYTGTSYQYSNGYTNKTNITLSGIGVFSRIHISDGFFLQLQPESNNIKYYEYVKETGYVINDLKDLQSTSFLVGVGFGSRDVGSMNYFTTILIDLQKDRYSPYRTYTGEISPIIRSGINFYFGRRKK